MSPTTQKKSPTPATFIALLRGINVGGHKPVAMSDLRDCLTSLGFSGVQSLLQSGNLVFQAPAQKTDDLERLLDAQTLKRLNLQTDFIIRTTAEWKAMIQANPFQAEARRDPGHLVVTFLKTAPSAKNISVLRASIAGPETIHADGRHLYITYPDGIGRSRLTNVLIETKLGVRATARNWNTVLKLATIADNPEPKGS